MHFRLVDQVLECTPDRAVTVKNVTLAEEYLQDHFPGFHVLPGVFMLEALVQSARLVLAARDLARAGGAPRRMVLGGVRALKYGMFVRPGESLRSEVTIDKETDDGSVIFRGSATVVRVSASASPDTAVSGRFTMRPVRMLQL
ncbi:MAG: beta-hydroxyacyl-ACP dehydratase [Phycisphaerales bacterium]|nr:beta-hydroxyacyl-ACP dehydratase [Phycisphaerales bacterium]